MPTDSVLPPASPVTFKRLALGFTLALALPAAAIGTFNAQHFPAATTFDLVVMGGMLMGTLLCGAWALRRGDQTDRVGLFFICLFGVGFFLRIAGTYLGPFNDLPLNQLSPPYLAWLPLLFVLAFVLLQSRTALYASLAFYAASCTVIGLYALPRILAPGPVDPALVGLMQQFAFGHLAYIVLLCAIPVLSSHALRSEREIRALKQLHRSESRFQDAFQHASIGMALVDTEGRFLHINDSLCQLLGRNRETLLASTFQTLTHPDDLDSDLENLQAVVVGESDHYRMEKRYIHSSGRILWAVLSVSVVRREDGSPEYYVSQIEDVTAEREYRAELRETNHKLRKMTSELTRSNKDLESFAYTVSHDLREPIRGVRGFAQLLLRRHADELGDEAREYLGHITQAASLGDDMIRALLDYSRVGRDLNREPVDSGQALSAALHGLRASIASHDLELVVPDTMPMVMASSVELRAVFQHLIANAIKFRKPDCRPRIVVKVRQADGFESFCVQDNGRGFDPRFREDVFNVFRKLDGRDTEGMGIGLAICRKAIERHGGRISADPQPGVGTRIIFTLPGHRQAVAA